MVGANSVVTKNCRDFSLSYGNPSKPIGWVGKDGYRLKKENGYYVDTKGNKYSNINNEEGIEILIELKPI
jgi:serine acetyltransferase